MPMYILTSAEFETFIVVLMKADVMLTGKLLLTSWRSVVLPPSGPVRLADFEVGGTEHMPF